MPVRFAITGAGMAGSRSSAECGSFDITFMACLPNMIVMAPCNEDELIDMVATAAQISDNPVCFRFPGGVAIGTTNPLKIVSPLEVTPGYAEDIIAKALFCIFQFLQEDFVFEY